jgi:hypothetical protein
VHATAVVVLGATTIRCCISGVAILFVRVFDETATRIW